MPDALTLLPEFHDEPVFEHLCPLSHAELGLRLCAWAGNRFFGAYQYDPDGYSVVAWDALSKEEPWQADEALSQFHGLVLSSDGEATASLAFGDSFWQIDLERLNAVGGESISNSSFRGRDYEVFEESLFVWSPSGQQLAVTMRRDDAPSELACVILDLKTWEAVDAIEVSRRVRPEVWDARGLVLLDSFEKAAWVWKQGWGLGTLGELACSSPDATASIGFQADQLVVRAAGETWSLRAGEDEGFCVPDLQSAALGLRWMGPHELHLVHREWGYISLDLATRVARPIARNLLHVWVSPDGRRVAGYELNQPPVWGAR